MAWRNWFQIHPETVFNQKSPTVISRNSSQVDVFKIGNDNAGTMACFKGRVFAQQIKFRPGNEILYNLVDDPRVEIRVSLASAARQLPPAFTKR